MMKTFLRSFFSSPPAESPAREVGTGRTESSISANWDREKRQYGCRGSAGRGRWERRSRRTFM
jgi:hypothetical protein